MAGEAPISRDTADALTSALGSRSIVFVGLMGAGKTAIGRKVAQGLKLPFADSDHEIEAAARMAVPELFERYGEAEFRALEARVIHRLLEDGPRVVSTGGGAFMTESTRAEIAAHGVSVWLKAELDVLVDRVGRRSNRPLLKTGEPREILARLMDLRYPVYATADVTVHTRDEKREVIAAEVIAALQGFLAVETPAGSALERAAS
ncbi:MAG TPA: shikimate kinase [Mesorhizobium sp.]|jgi:shikimate kinase|nr:shikimate kinase [Mesorhizobium sp.]